MRSIEISPDILAIRHEFGIPAGPGIRLERFVYSYILFGDTITLIDTGVHGCEQRIAEAVQSRGRRMEEVTLVVLTHSHPDHIGAAAGIWGATGCRIAAHPAERAWIEDTARQNRERPVPGFDRLVGGPVPVDILLEDGTGIAPEETGGREIRVFHTPGHSPGSVSLLAADEGALFTGDAVPVPGDLPVYDDPLASLQSLRKLSRLTQIRHLLSAWDEPRTGREAFLQIDRAAEYLLEIHRIVRREAEDSGDTDRFVRSVAAALGLPPGMAGPMLARTLAANLRVKDHEIL